MTNHPAPTPAQARRRAALRAGPLASALALCALTLGAARAQDSSADERWRFTPRFGMSSGTGMFGVEIDRGHWGAATGVIAICAWYCADIRTFALKYNFQTQGSGWSTQLFLWRWRDYDTSQSFLGAGVEYRWYFSRGWNLSTGLVVGEQGQDVEIINPGLTLSVGYTF